MSQSFYLTLPSNVKSLTHNTIANYKTYLPNTLKLGENWEVGLAEITYTKSWINVKSKHKFTLVISQENHTLSRDIHMRADYYHSIETLCTELNLVLESLTEAFGYTGIAPFLEWSPLAQRVLQRAGSAIRDPKTNMFVHLGEELEAMLGFDNPTPKSMLVNNTNKKNLFGRLLENTNARIADRHYDMKAGIHALMVYSDIVEPSIVGNMQAQLLRSCRIDSNTRYGDDINIIFDKPYYFPLMCNEINSILIDIKDEAGENIHFDFGRVFVILHFRQKWRAII